MPVENKLLNMYENIYVDVKITIEFYGRDVTSIFSLNYVVSINS